MCAAAPRLNAERKSCVIDGRQQRLDKSSVAVCAQQMIEVDAPMAGIILPGYYLVLSNVLSQYCYALYGCSRLLY